MGERRNVRIATLPTGVPKLDDVLGGGLPEFSFNLIVVDSFRSLTRAAKAGEAAEIDLQNFVQRLAVYLTSWHATTFLIGEYSGGEMGENPVATVADGVLWLTQSVVRNSMVRKLQVVKM